MTAIAMRPAHLLLACSLALAACGQDARDYAASGKAFLDQGRDAEAIIELKNAAQANVSRADVRYMLGVALRRTGDLQAAEIELRKAESLGHDPDLVRPQLAAVLVEGAKAEILLKEVTLDGMTQPAAKAEVTARRGDALLGTGKVADAERAYGDALLLDPANEAAQLGRVRLAIMRNDVANAWALLQPVLQQQPDSLSAQLMKAGLLQRAGNVAESIAAYDRAIALRPVDVRAYVAVIPMLIAAKDVAGAETRLEKLKKVSPRGIATGYLEALVAYSRGDLPRARDFIRMVVRASPDDVRALLLAGNVEHDLGNYVQAQQYLLKVLAGRPGEAHPRRLLASTYGRLGQYDKAKEVLAPLLRAEPVDPSTLLMAAEVSTGLHDNAQALAYLERAVALDSKDASFRVRLGEAYLRVGRADLGIRELEAASAADPTSVSADVILINQYLARDQVAKARAAADALVQRHADKPIVYNTLGLVHLMEGLQPAAREAFAKALTLEPTFLPAARNLARLDLRERNPQAARGRYVAILAKDPKVEDASLALADLLMQTDAPDAEVLKVYDTAVAANPAAVRSRLAKIDFLTRKGRAKDALEAASQAAADLPQDTTVLLTLARTQLANRDSTRAATSFGKLVGLMPGSAVPYVGEADAHALEKNWTAARAAMAQAVVAQPDSLPIRLAKLDIDIRAERFDDARAEAALIRQRWPASAAGYAAEARVFASRKQFAEAVQRLQAGVAATGDGALVVNLHGLLVDQGRAPEAEAQAEKWIATHPKDFRVMVSIGDTLLRKDDYRGAERWLRRADAVSPNDVAILNNLAWVMGKLGDPQALAVGERALAKAPGDPAVIDTVGWLHVQRGDLQKGIDMLGGAVKLAPGMPSLRLNLARALVAAGRKTEARPHLDAALVAAPDSERMKREVDEIRRQL